jgi:hypothetical protein
MKDTPFSSFEEVWEALNRLYLATEQLKESARLVVESQVSNVKQLNELTVAMTELARVQLDYAKRLERLEGLPPL